LEEKGVDGNNIKTDLREIGMEGRRNLELVNRWIPKKADYFFSS
jgi:hypothetical protein